MAQSTWSTYGRIYDVVDSGSSTRQVRVLDAPGTPSPATITISDSHRVAAVHPDDSSISYGCVRAEDDGTFILTIPTDAGDEDGHVELLLKDGSTTLGLTSRVLIGRGRLSIGTTIIHDSSSLSAPAADRLFTGLALRHDGSVVQADKTDTEVRVRALLMLPTGSSVTLDTHTLGDDGNFDFRFPATVTEGSTATIALQLVYVEIDTAPDPDVETETVLATTRIIGPIGEATHMVLAGRSEGLPGIDELTWLTDSTGLDLWSSLATMDLTSQPALDALARATGVSGRAVSTIGLTYRLHAELGTLDSGPIALLSDGERRVVAQAVASARSASRLFAYPAPAAVSIEGILQEAARHHFVHRDYLAAATAQDLAERVVEMIEVHRASTLTTNLDALIPLSFGSTFASTADKTAFVQVVARAALRNRLEMPHVDAAAFDAELDDYIPTTSITLTSGDRDTLRDHARYLASLWRASGAHGVLVNEQVAQSVDDLATLASLSPTALATHIATVGAPTGAASEQAYLRDFLTALAADHPTRMIEGRATGESTDIQTALSHYAGLGVDLADIDVPAAAADPAAVGWNPAAPDDVAVAAKRLGRIRGLVRILDSLEPWLTISTLEAMSGLHASSPGIRAYGRSFVDDFASALAEARNDGVLYPITGATPIDETESYKEAHALADRIYNNAVAAAQLSQHHRLASMQLEATQQLRFGGGLPASTVPTVPTGWCACDPCESCFSPGAYLLDLLLQLNNTESDDISLLTALERVNDDTTTNGKLLNHRRDEIGDMPLDCDNTYVELPHIDLVLELLEWHAVAVRVAQDSSLVGVDVSGISTEGPLSLPQHTIGPSEARRIEAEHTQNRPTADALLAASRFPRPCPVDPEESELRALLGREGVRREDLMLWASSRATPSLRPTPSSDDLARAGLNLTPLEYSLLTLQDPEATGEEIWLWYGHDGTAPTADFETWRNDVANVASFLKRTDTSLEQLTELLSTRFVNPGFHIGILTGDDPCDLTSATLSKEAYVIVSADAVEDSGAYQLTATIEGGKIFLSSGFVTPTPPVGSTSHTSISLTEEQVRYLVVADAEPGTEILTTAADGDRVLARIITSGDPPVVYVDTAPLDAFFLRVMRILTLSKGLNLGFREVDNLIFAVFGTTMWTNSSWTASNVRALHDAARLARLLDLGMEDLQLLLRGWDTFGAWDGRVSHTSSAYDSRFQNPVLYAPVDPLLALHGGRASLAAAADIPIAPDLLGPVLAATGLSRADQEAIWAAHGSHAWALPNEGATGTDLVLDLGNLHGLGRLATLARALRISVSELLHLAELDRQATFWNDLGGPVTDVAGFSAFVERARRIIDTAQPSTWLAIRDDATQDGTGRVTTHTIANDFNALAGAHRAAWAEVQGWFDVLTAPESAVPATATTATERIAVFNRMLAALGSPLDGSTLWSGLAVSENAIAPYLAWMDSHDTFPASPSEASWSAWGAQLQFPADAGDARADVADAAVEWFTDLAVVSAAAYLDNTASIRSTLEAPDAFWAALEQALDGLLTDVDTPETSVVADEIMRVATMPSFPGTSTSVDLEESLATAVAKLDSEDADWVPLPPLAIAAPGVATPPVEILEAHEWLEALWETPVKPVAERVALVLGLIWTAKAKAAVVQAAATWFAGSERLASTILDKLVPHLANFSFVDESPLVDFLDTSFASIGQDLAVFDADVDLTPTDPQPPRYAYYAHAIRVAKTGTLKSLSGIGDSSIGWWLMPQAGTEASPLPTTHPSMPRIAALPAATDAAVGEPFDAAGIDMGLRLASIELQIPDEADFGAHDLMGQIADFASSPVELVGSIETILDVDNDTASLLLGIEGLGASSISIDTDPTPQLVAVEDLMSLQSTARRLGIPYELLLDLRRTDHASITAPRLSDRVRQALRIVHSDSSWTHAYQPIADALRVLRRDALTAWVTHHHPQLDSPNDLAVRLLTDPLVEPVVQTSRMVFATEAVQRFVDRTLQGLETYAGTALVAPRSIAARWSWMRAYRVWEAAMKVYVHPESWVSPDLRLDNTPLFEDLQQTVTSPSLDPKTAADAYVRYWEGLAAVGQLDVVSLFHQKTSEDLYFLARTREEYPTYYVRQKRAGRGWTPWDIVPTDVGGFSPTIAATSGGRIVVFWLKFDPSSSAPATQEGPLGTVSLYSLEKTAAGWASAAVVLPWFLYSRTTGLPTGPPTAYNYVQWNRQLGGALLFENPVPHTYLSVREPIQEPGTTTSLLEKNRGPSNAEVLSVAAYLTLDENGRRTDALLGVARQEPGKLAATKTDSTFEEFEELRTFDAITSGVERIHGICYPSVGAPGNPLGRVPTNVVTSMGVEVDHIVGGQSPPSFLQNEVSLRASGVLLNVNQQPGHGKPVVRMVVEHAPIAFDDHMVLDGGNRAYLVRVQARVQSTLG